MGYSSANNRANEGGFLTQLDQRRGGTVAIGVSMPIFDGGVTSIARQRAQILLENERLSCATRSSRALMSYYTGVLDPNAVRL